MVERGRGHIINIGSIAGDAAYPGGSVYCATKAAVKALSDGLRIDLVDTPLRVTNVKPGMVETNFTVVRYRGDKEAADNFYKGIRPLTGDDIAETVYFCRVGSCTYSDCGGTFDAYLSGNRHYFV